MSRGQSLIETLIMISILAVLLYIGAASFHGLEPKFRLQAAAWEIVSRLNQARFRAIRDGAPVRVKFADRRYRLEAWDEETAAWKLVDGSALAGVALKANNAPVFYPEGTVSNLATILVSNSGGGYRITLAMTGRVKVVSD